MLTDFDLYLLGEGNHYRIYEKLGAHVISQDGTLGTHFAVWAPNARQVSVIGEFNNWQPTPIRCMPRQSSGVWEGFIPGCRTGALYKYCITSQYSDYRVGKGRPVRFRGGDQAANRVEGLGPRRLYLGRSLTGCRNGGRHHALGPPPSRFMKSTSAPGSACPRKATAG